MREFGRRSEHGEPDQAEHNQQGEDGEDLFFARGDGQGHEMKRKNQRDPDFAGRVGSPKRSINA